MAITVIRYHRYSDAGQDRGSSLIRQRERTEEMCRVHGWPVTQPIEDRGRSAWKGDHLRVGHLGEIKAAIDAGDYEPGSILVIENFDRLSRENVKKARRWIEEVTEAGIKVAVWSKNKIFDDASLSGENIVELLEYLLEVKRANEESARKADFRVKVNTDHIEKAKRGEIYTPRAPLWLMEVDGCWAENPERGDIVRLIYEWCADDLGYGAICKNLNAGYEPWAANKKSRPEWRIGYVRDILHSPAVEGEYHRKMVGEDRDEIILGYYPRIVDAALVESARNKIKGRQRTGGKAAPESRNLFVGRVTCAYCDGPMMKTVNYNRQGTRYYYLLCRGVRGGTCDNSTQYRYDLFERGALREILHLSLDNSHFVKVDETGPLIARTAELRKEIEQAGAERAAQNRAMTIAGAKGLDIEFFVDEIGKITTRLKGLEGALSEAEEALSRARGNVSPEEHLRRVVEVRDGLDSPDEETRQQARRMVRSAMRSVIKDISFGHQWTKADKRERRLHMVLDGSHVHLWFDGNGNVVKSRDLLDMDPNSVFAKMLVNSSENPEGAAASVRDQLRRRNRRADH